MSYIRVFNTTHLIRFFNPRSILTPCTSAKVHKCTSPNEQHSGRSGKEKRNNNAPPRRDARNDSIRKIPKNICSTRTCQVRVGHTSQTTFVNELNPDLSSPG